MTYSQVYPDNINPTIIDLTSDSEGDGLEAYWEHNLKKIQSDSSRMMQYQDEKNKIEHLSIFAIAPIPLLIQFGLILNDGIPSDLYQFHRSTGKWNWLSDNSDTEYIIEKPKQINKSQEPVLVLALSDFVEVDKFPEILRGNQNIYRITIEKPSTEFLVCRNLIDKFRSIYRETLNVIQKEHGVDTPIHLLSAIPAPIAVEVGKSLLLKKDPPLFIYDFNKKFGGMRKIFEINN